MWLHLLCLVAACAAAVARAGPCEVETGQSSIIVDIEESRGGHLDQHTTPEELPILGEPDEISMNLIFPRGRTLFMLVGKKLKLIEPLDRDEENLSHIVFQLVCQVVSTGKKRTIPLIVRVSDINDNAPVFQGTPYETTVPELTPVGTTIFQSIKATDADAGVNGLAEYFIIPWDNSTRNTDGHSEATDGHNEATNGVADGFGYFSINLPHQGQVTVNRSLDFEKTHTYLVQIVASDRARNSKERFSSTTTLTVHVKDDDDQDPSFIYQGCMLHDGACINPEYTSSVNSGQLAGVLNISPEKIQAVDMDTLDAPIRYSLMSGSPQSYGKYFQVDPSTGVVRQVAAVDTSVAKKFDLIIKAEEVSESARFTTAKLTITVQPVDANPPVITTTAVEGFVEENAPVGTKILDKEGKPVTLIVTDADLSPADPKPTYTFELTTNFFDIDKNSNLIVNEENLDRDPPSPGTFRFQVVAREINGVVASAPLSLIVQLKDVNDNPPVLARLTPLTVPAGDEPQQVTRIQATDADEGENAHIRYTFFHVSNNGASKFKINPDTGIIESTGRLSAGEQFSLTVVATDGGGLSAQGIVEVVVSRGPNKRAPHFSSHEYHSQVSEGAAINSTLATVTAKDPENESVLYSIISGNDLRQFAIGPTTGIITVIRKLDREQLTRYQLLIKAEDPGKLSSTATVNIKVTDINDNNPEFEEEAYKFQVKEGAENAAVGQVHASDADEGVNAVVSYAIPHDLPFAIDNNTGVITTRRALDYETQKEYQFVVTATDGAVDRRIGTASVLVGVLDIADEPPVFREPAYHATVPENVPNYPVIQVQAFDPDTVQEITYIIKRGDMELFSIDRKLGTIRTLQALDREKAARHTLLIGTEENDSDDENATTTVEVDVEDKNDNAPMFTSLPRPATIDSQAAIGTLVATLLAADADATPPNNRVRYQLAGRGKATKYFQVDPDTGAVRVRDQLTKETDSEYSVDIRAYDLGEPQMSTVSMLTVYVSHSATVSPDVGLGFADTLYTEHVSEKAKNGTLIRNLVLLNKRAHQQNIPLKCHLIAGNEDGLFYVRITEERDCALYLNTSSLDYEMRNEYTLGVQLESLQGLINPQYSEAVLKVHIVDENDNSPIFTFPEQSNIPSAKGKYFATVTKETLLDTNVVQVKAKDKDSAKFGRIEYQQSSWPKHVEEYFSLDSDTGVIKNIKTFESVSNEILPFKLQVLARDNPQSRDNYNVARSVVIINILQKENQLVLEFNDLNPENVRRQTRSLVSVLEDKCGLIAGIEKVTSRHYIGENDTLETDPAGTDLWFYLIDPVSGKILDRDSDIVKKHVLSPSARSNVTFFATSVARGTAVGVHAPLAPPPPARVTPGVVTPARSLPAAVPAALVALASIVFVLGVVSVIYICTSWNKYKKYKQSMQRHYSTGTLGGATVAGSTLPYESVLVSAVPSESGAALEYETQVLNMAVPIDDNTADLQIDFSGNNNHAFNLDNVSYVTKDNGEHSPTLSETATTARASSVNGTRSLHGDTQTLGRHTNHQNNNALRNNLGTLPRVDNRNNSAGLLASTLGRKMNGGGKKKNSTSNAIMAYDEIPGSGYQRSTDNDNVTFGKRNYSQFGFSYLNDRSPVETTTEL